MDVSDSSMHEMFNMDVKPDYSIQWHALEIEPHLMNGCYLFIMDADMNLHYR